MIQQESRLKVADNITLFSDVAYSRFDLTARIASNMFWLSEEEEPSVPMPTVTPARSAARTGASLRG